MGDELHDPRRRSNGYVFISIPIAWLDERPMSQIPHNALGIYSRLYLLAGKFNKAGALEDHRGPLETKDIAYVLRCDQAELEEIMEVLVYCGLLVREGDVWKIPSFTMEQVNIDALREQWRRKKAEKSRAKREAEADKESNEEQESEINESTESEPDEKEKIKKESRHKPQKMKKTQTEPEKKQEETKGKAEEEVEEEVLQSIHEEYVGIPAAAAAAAEALFQPVSSSIFQTVYREGKPRYKTADVLRGIRAMLVVTVLHNLQHEDKWDNYNLRMALELCDSAKRKERLARARADYLGLDRPDDP